MLPRAHDAEQACQQRAGDLVRDALLDPVVRWDAETTEAPQVLKKGKAKAKAKAAAADDDDMMDDGDENGSSSSS